MVQCHSFALDEKEPGSRPGGVSIQASGESQASVLLVALPVLAKRKGCSKKGIHPNICTKSNVQATVAISLGTKGAAKST